jgi:hypothetical protein
LAEQWHNALTAIIRHKRRQMDLAAIVATIFASVYRAAVSARKKSKQNT